MSRTLLTLSQNFCNNLVPNSNPEPKLYLKPPSFTDEIIGLNARLKGAGPGVVLLPKKYRTATATLQVAIDLNAVPPAGIEGVEVMDKGKERDKIVCYGAIGVGDTKMKAHKAALAKLFESNTAVLDIEQVYEIALRLP